MFSPLVETDIFENTALRIYLTMTRTDKNLYSFDIFLFIPFYYLYITTIPFQQKKQKKNEREEEISDYLCF